MTQNEIRTLYEFNYWAKGRMLGVLDSLPEEELYKDLKTSFGGIHSTIVHICAAEDIWLKRFTGALGPKFLKDPDLPKYSDVKTKWMEVEKSMVEYVQSISDEQLQKSFSYTNIKGEAFTNIRWHALQHLVNHSTYHRGQITSMVRQLGGTPVSTDLIAFYRQKP